jgi:NADH:ubiquinone oxidoreductase subunit
LKLFCQIEAQKMGSDTVKIFYYNVKIEINEASKPGLINKEMFMSSTIVPSHNSSMHFLGGVGNFDNHFQNLDDIGETPDVSDEEYVPEQVILDKFVQN